MATLLAFATAGGGIVNRASAGLGVYFSDSFIENSYLQDITAQVAFGVEDIVSSFTNRKIGYTARYISCHMVTFAIETAKVFFSVLATSLVCSAFSLSAAPFSLIGSATLCAVSYINPIRALSITTRYLANIISYDDMNRQDIAVTVDNYPIPYCWKCIGSLSQENKRYFTILKDKKCYLSNIDLIPLRVGDNLTNQLLVAVDKAPLFGRLVRMKNNALFEFDAEYSLNKTEIPIAQAYYA